MKKSPSLFLWVSPNPCSRGFKIPVYSQGSRKEFHIFSDTWLTVKMPDNLPPGSLLYLAGPCCSPEQAWVRGSPEQADPGRCLLLLPELQDVSQLRCEHLLVFLFYIFFNNLFELKFAACRIINANGLILISEFPHIYSSIPCKHFHFSLFLVSHLFLL